MNKYIVFSAAALIVLLVLLTWFFRPEDREMRVSPQASTQVDDMASTPTADAPHGADSESFTEVKRSQTPILNAGVNVVLVDEEGNRLPLAHIALYHSGTGECLFTTRSDPDGRVFAHGQWPAEIYLLATHETSVGKSAIVEMISTTNGEIDSRVLILKKGVTLLAGIIHDAGELVSALQVKSISRENTERAVTDDAGYFCLTLPGSGAGSLRIENNGEIYFSRPFAIEGGDASFTVLELPSGSIKIELEREQSILHSTMPVEVCAQLITEPGSKPRRVVIETDGAASIRYCPAGDYLITAQSGDVEMRRGRVISSVCEPQIITVSHEEVRVPVRIVTPRRVRVKALDPHTGEAVTATVILSTPSRGVIGQVNDRVLLLPKQWTEFSLPPGDLILVATNPRVGVGAAAVDRALNDVSEVIIHLRAEYEPFTVKLSGSASESVRRVELYAASGGLAFAIDKRAEAPDGNLQEGTIHAIDASSLSAPDCEIEWREEFGPIMLSYGEYALVCRDRFGRIIHTERHTLSGQPFIYLRIESGSGQ